MLCCRNGKNKSISGCLILLIFAIAMLTSRENIHPKEPALNISKRVAKEDINDISLTIYYLNPFILTRYPLSAEDLISFTDVQKIVIRGGDLEEPMDLLKQINDDLESVKKKSRVNARIYYVFESKKNGKLFDVAMWGRDSSVFVNGVEVKGNDIFYDVIKTFLPEDTV
ncbi:hypothetical protein [Paenibacillus sp. FSL R7-0331]|uniref:hypothetical protein n=1 Tax=Paenibacillus sp. FSL R7-0331 TaxID=1536773 RepID=UPI0004F66F5B|nr:hypothetical protein [Paenibacillus sp. FSL R7-0331]AIQ54616.1 hypothetical protein R70331_25985 [Paenibacillus sp. FSL R7-0331]